MYRDGPYTKGILRKSANSVKCKEIHDKLDEGEECLDDNIQTLVVGAVLKVKSVKFYKNMKLIFNITVQK